MDTLKIATALSMKTLDITFNTDIYDYDITTYPKKQCADDMFFLLC